MKTDSYRLSKVPRYSRRQERHLRSTLRRVWPETFTKQFILCLSTWTRMTMLINSIKRPWGIWARISWSLSANPPGGWAKDSEATSNHGTRSWIWVFAMINWLRKPSYSRPTPQKTLKWAWTYEEHYLVTSECTGKQSFWRILSLKTQGKQEWKNWTGWKG